MNPDKLFDYLDGKLSPADRAAVEDKLMSDTQLRKQFEVAREIHRSGRTTREVIVPSEDPEVVAQGSRLGRQILTAAFVLIVLNVAGGLAVISWRQHKDSATRAHDANVRQQLEQSLGAAGRNALPTPSLNDDEINLAAPRAEWDRLAAAVTTAAQAAGGSAIRDDRENEIILTASIPQAKTAEFRKQVLGPNAVTPTSLSDGAGATATVQVRIAESAR